MRWYHVFRCLGYTPDLNIGVPSVLQMLRTHAGFDFRMTRT